MGPTSLIAANKRDYHLPDPCFLCTQGGRLHRHANLSAVTGAQRPPRLSDTVRRGCTRAAGAVSKCVWQGPTGGGPPDWVLRGETPTEAQYINRGSGQRKRSTRLLKKLPRAHTRCRGGRPL